MDSSASWYLYIGLLIYEYVLEIYFQRDFKILDSEKWARWNLLVVQICLFFFSGNIFLGRNNWMQRFFDSEFVLDMVLSRGNFLIFPVVLLSLNENCTDYNGK